MLEEERFLAIKKLARDIRKENENILKKIEKMPVKESIEEKNKFIDSIMENMTGAFSGGEQGKEEKQIFRANILIPEDEEFYETYSNNKNIRKLMEKYAVNIEDVMSKITELNIYGKYVNNEKDETDFVDEMVKISPKQAENLLDEIDDLSNTLTNLDLSEIKEKSSKIEYETPKRKTFINKENKPASFINDDIKKEIEEDYTDEPFVNDEEKDDIDIEIENDNILDESFDSINRAISGFVTDYNSIKDKVKDKETEIKDLGEKIRKLNLENEKLTEENNTLHSRQSEYRQDNNKLKSDNNKLNSEIKKLNLENEKINSRMKLLEDKLIKTAALLNKVYNGIHKD
ncbi:MAG: hypothetical protein IKF91_06005 [Bacilli bacterium]|nr:hypothetical protein [Bacilli bacterium]